MEKNESKIQVAQDQKARHAKRWSFLRRTPSIFNRFESPAVFNRIGSYIKPGQIVADIGCGWGYYTFALADRVGPQGKIYAVDLGEKPIRSIKKNADRKGYQNIEVHASTAADLRFIKDSSVDFVFANGLLCSMENDRDAAVNEMKRILKLEGLAYISLGAHPPLGLVDEDEWRMILGGFKVKEGGSYQALWALTALLGASI